MATLKPDTRSELLRLARAHLVEDGLSRFSLRRVAESAQISPAAVYRHFRDRDALLGEVLHEGAQRFRSYLMDALTESTPEARLRVMGMRYFAFAFEHPHDYELLFMVKQSEETRAVSEKAQAQSGAAFQLLVDRIVECQRTGLFRQGPPEAMAFFIWSSLHGLVTLDLVGCIGPGTPGRDILAQAQIQALFDALVAKT